MLLYGAAISCTHPGLHVVSHYHCIDWTRVSVGSWLQIMITESPSFLSNFPSLSLSAVHFQVNTRRTYLASCSTRPIPSICVPTLSRTASTGWPSRSHSWTPPWKKVGQKVASMRGKAQQIIIAHSPASFFFFFYLPNHLSSLPPFMFSVSLQDINMRKAFKSSTTQDQQVVSKSSVPNPVREMYNLSDKPPPLNILSSYRSVLSMHTRIHQTLRPPA